MAFTYAERQKKRREKMRELNLSLAQFWVPKDRVMEIKSVAIRMAEEGFQDKEPRQRQLPSLNFYVTRKG
jgi:hypothetical protein